MDRVLTIVYTSLTSTVIAVIVMLLINILNLLLKSMNSGTLMSGPTDAVVYAVLSHLLMYHFSIYSVHM